IARADSHDRNRWPTRRRMSTDTTATRHCVTMCGWHNQPGIGGFMLQLQSAFGVAALLAIAWACGENRRAVSLQRAAIGLAVTLATAIVPLKLPVGAGAVRGLKRVC